MEASLGDLGDRPSDFHHALSKGTDMLSVTVTFRIDTHYWEAFRRAVLANAAETLARESGCHSFEVCEKVDAAEIFLFELYDDAAAFERHLASAHYVAFAELIAPWVLDKRVVCYDRIGS
jgi:quinol monooxygenase YgiN